MAKTTIDPNAKHTTAIDAFGSIEHEAAIESVKNHLTALSKVKEYVEASIPVDALTMLAYADKSVDNIKKTAKDIYASSECTERITHNGSTIYQTTTVSATVPLAHFKDEYQAWYSAVDLKLTGTQIKTMSKEAPSDFMDEINATRTETQTVKVSTELGALKESIEIAKWMDAQNIDAGSIVGYIMKALERTIDSQIGKMTDDDKEAIISRLNTVSDRLAGGN